MAHQMLRAEVASAATIGGGSASAPLAYTSLCGTSAALSSAADASASAPSDAGQHYEAASMSLDALLACLNGVGADWRRGGYDEGRPRMLSRAQLSTVMAAQVSRMQASAASAAASGGLGAGAGAGLEAAAVGGGEALMQLMRSKWDVTKAVRATLEAMATAAAAAAAAAGKVPPTAASAASAATADAPKTQDELVCGICFDAPEAPEALRAMSCGHAYCDDCWGGTLGAAMERGRACIHDSCPEPSCSLPVSGEIWAAVVSKRGGKSSALLHSLALRSFVDCNSLLAYCPSGACGTAAAYAQPRAPPEIVRCRCGTSYCVLCSEPPHWPLSCARRQKWSELLNQSPDARAIMQLTRPCPSCGVRTQRSAGCMHITCTQCGSEWCWGCGLVGKKGEVHHSFACTRRPDPSWSYESEERKAVDGSLTLYLDEWLYRKEQMEMLEEAGAAEEAEAAEEAAEEEEAAEMEVDLTAAEQEEAMATKGGAPSSPRQTTVQADRRAAAARGLTPKLLRPTLQRALGVLRWLEVYRYYAPQHGLPARTRLAIGRLTTCTDELMAACGHADAGGGLHGGGVAPDWAFLATDAAELRHSWLVTCLLFLFAHLPAGPVVDPPASSKK